MEGLQVLRQKCLITPYSGMAGRTLANRPFVRMYATSLKEKSKIADQLVVVGWSNKIISIKSRFKECPIEFSWKRQSKRRCTVAHKMTIRRVWPLSPESLSRRMVNPSWNLKKRELNHSRTTCSLRNSITELRPKMLQRPGSVYPRMR